MSNENSQHKSYSDRLIEYMESLGNATMSIDEIGQEIRLFSKREYEKRKSNTDVLPFGKYRFKKVKDVAAFDKQYLVWLSKQDMLNKYEGLKANIMDNI